MLSFELYQPAHVLFGEGKAAQAGELLTELGARHAFLVCDEGVERAGIVARVVKSIRLAGIDVTIYSGVMPDPTAAMIDEAAALCREEACDAVVAVGGGSCMDAAKGVNLLRYNGGGILDYIDPARKFRPTENLVVIPTTAGTGSELSDGLVVTDDEHRKCPVLAADARVNFIIFDPELTAGLPPALTASTGMDALAHAVESYTSTAASVFSDRISAANIESILHWLPRAVENGNDMAARTQMQAASALCGWMLCYGHTHAGHSVAHVLGSRLGIPHGLACGYALPWVVEFNAPAVLEKTRRLGEWLGCRFTGEETPRKVGSAVREALIAFRDEAIGLPPLLAPLPERALLEQMALEIEGELFQAFNARLMTKNDALIILENIFCPKAAVVLQ